MYHNSDVSSSFNKDDIIIMDIIISSYEKEKDITDAAVVALQKLHGTLDVRVEIRSTKCNPSSKRFRIIGSTYFRIKR